LPLYHISCELFLAYLPTIYLKTLIWYLFPAWALVYTLSNCGGKWVKVGKFSGKTLNSKAKMGRLEQMF